MVKNLSLCFQRLYIPGIRSNTKSFKKFQILQLNTTKLSNILQSLLNDTKLIDYRFLFLTKL